MATPYDAPRKGCRTQSHSRILDRGLHTPYRLLSWSARRAPVLISGLLLGALCSCSSPTANEVAVREVDPEALYSNLFNAPLASDLTYGSRRFILEGLGVTLDSLAAGFDEIELSIEKCMMLEGFEYVRTPGSEIAHATWLPEVPMPTAGGYFLTASSPQTILPRPTRWMDAVTDLEPAARNRYTAALFGTDVNDFDGGCSGQALSTFGPPNLDTVFETGGSALVDHAAKSEDYLEAQRLWRKCTGFDRIEEISQWSKRWQEADQPAVVLLDEATKSAQSDLRCAEDHYRPIDDRLRDDWSRIIRMDYSEICRIREEADSQIFGARESVFCS